MYEIIGLPLGEIRDGRIYIKYNTRMKNSMPLDGLFTSFDEEAKCLEVTLFKPPEGSEFLEQREEIIEIPEGTKAIDFAQTNNYPTIEMVAESN